MSSVSCCVHHHWLIMILKMPKELKLYCYIEQTNQNLAPSRVRVDSHRVQADYGTRRMILAHPAHSRVDSSKAKVDSRRKSQKDALPL